MAIDWSTVEHLLGVEFDAEIAKVVGVTATTVGNERRRRGIPPVVRGRPSPIDWRRVPDLGVLSDGEIAGRLGVSHQSVQRARQRLGVPSAYLPGGPPCRRPPPPSDDCEGVPEGIDCDDCDEEV